MFMLSNQEVRAFLTYGVTLKNYKPIENFNIVECIVYDCLINIQNNNIDTSFKKYDLEKNKFFELFCKSIAFEVYKNYDKISGINYFLSEIWYLQVLHLQIARNCKCPNCKTILKINIFVYFEHHPNIFNMDQNLFKYQIIRLPDPSKYKSIRKMIK